MTECLATHAKADFTGVLMAWLDVILFGCHQLQPSLAIVSIIWGRWLCKVSFTQTRFLYVGGDVFWEYKRMTIGCFQMLWMQKSRLLTILTKNDFAVEMRMFVTMMKYHLIRTLSGTTIISLFAYEHQAWCHCSVYGLGSCQVNKAVCVPLLLSDCHGYVNLWTSAILVSISWKWRIHWLSLCNLGRMAT